MMMMIYCQTISQLAGVQYSKYNKHNWFLYADKHIFYGH